MIQKIKVFLNLIKFEHTVFALPFAYLGMIMAHHWLPRISIFFWITVAMASARTAGMSLNRLVDRKIDELNPRTKNRPSVTGEFPAAGIWAAVGISLVIFFLSARMLNPLCFKLSFVAIVFLTGYHYVKRFSFLCHFTLGLVLAIAPMGGWLAVTGAFSWVPAPLAMAVLFWAAGFDIIYALQDADFDRANGLYSIPAQFGQTQGLKISRICHGVTVGFLALFGLVASLSAVYWAGLVICAILLWIEHALIRDEDLSYINTAFFTINGWVGVLLLVFTFLDLYR